MGERPQFPHLFERRPDWLIVMWSAANVTVRPNSMQTKTLKSGWRTIRPIIVELLTAWIQVDRFAMEKEEITDVELLDGAVEHVRKARGTRQDLANWSTHGAEIDRACIQHAIQNSEPGSLLSRE